jgi:predicted lactoylglutathione lyase
MIGYVTLGTNDIGKAAEFYDALLEQTGAKRLMEGDNFIAWGVSMDQPGLSVIKPHDGGAATAGNGTMIALSFDSRDKVDAIHAKALELGGSDEGAPGVRNGGFYAAYFRDPEGHKFCCFNMGAPE